MKLLGTKALIGAGGKVLPLLMVILYIMTGLEKASAQITPAFSHSRWNKTITFTDQTSNPNAYYTAKTMIYGDGTSDTAFTMGSTSTHTYTRYGTYKVTLKIYSTAFTTTFDTSEYVNIDSCAAGNFRLDNSGANTIELTALDTADQDSVHYFYNTGDGDTTNKAHCFHRYTSDGTYHVCLTKINMKTGCTSYNCKEITVKEGIVSSLQQETDSRQSVLQLYPNPVQSQLLISYKSGTNVSANYTITDMLGHAYITERLLTDEYGIQKVISVSQLSAGLYILQLNLPGKVLQSRFIKVN
jgi:PKD repeat protein